MSFRVYLAGREIIRCVFDKLDRPHHALLEEPLISLRVRRPLTTSKGV